MRRGSVVQILFVEGDASARQPVEAFFAHQLELVGARASLHFRPRLPERAAGFDLVSLDGRSLLPFLTDRPELQGDLRSTPIVNLHAERPGALFGHLQLLLGRSGERAVPDGLWVFPLSWMATWFQEPLEFPELGLVAAPRPPRQPNPDRTWERRSFTTLQALGLPTLSPIAPG